MHRLPRIRGHGPRRDRQIKLVKGGANIGWGGERGPFDEVAFTLEYAVLQKRQGRRRQGQEIRDMRENVSHSFSII